MNQDELRARNEELQSTNERQTAIIRELERRIGDRERANEKQQSPRSATARPIFAPDNPPSDTEPENRLSARTSDPASASRRRAERLSELTLQLAGVEQRERRRLAKILHDHVQQLLVAARMRVEIARQEPLPGDIAEQLRQTIEILDEAVDAARTLSVQLSPPLLHEHGLAAALKWLATRFEKQHQLQVDIEADETADIGSEVFREVLFQVARELLLNVSKHAETDRARIRLSRTDQALTLVVEDDGTGFQISELKVGDVSFGLFYVRERVEELGGTMTIDSWPGAGTRVILSVPRTTATS